MKKSIHIVLAMDEPYWHKAKQFGLFESLKKHTSQDESIFVKTLCIGFKIDKSDDYLKNERWSFASCNMPELKSYREGFPRNQKNRKFFVCAEGGEFLDFFSFKDSDIIVHLDADTTMQRPFTVCEKNKILSLKEGQVASTYHAIPEISLEQELSALRLREPIKNVAKHFPDNWDKPIFCTGLIVATAKTYRSVIYKNYLPNIDKMVMLFDHHAGGQWLMNQVVYKHGDFVDLGRSFGHADWFIGSDPSDIKDGKLCYKGQTILFNHHKFNKKWEY